MGGESHRPCGGFPVAMTFKTLLSKNLLTVVVIAVFIILIASAWYLFIQNRAYSNTLSKLSNETNASGLGTITAAEIAPYLDGVVEIDCSAPGNTSGEPDESGSGSLMEMVAKVPTYYVMSNEHVLNTAQNYTCSISLNGEGTNGGIYPMETGFQLRDLDVAYGLIGKSVVDIPNTPPVSQLDYSIGALPHCPIRMPVGSPVAVIGYPADGDTTVQADGITGTLNNEVTTNGTISGYDESTVADALPDVNYLVTATVDAGNSGGVAISKNQHGLCLLGIPTWDNTGIYADMGIMQSINNIAQ